MKTPYVFIAYAPRGAGLRCALVYVASGNDLYGWFTGPREDGSIAAEYFVVEDFYTSRPGGYRTVDGTALDHELARIQETFARHWLLYRDDPHAARDLAAYARAELATGQVCLRFERIAKLSTLQPNWTYYSPQCEHTVLRYLAKRWPLEYRLDLAEASSAATSSSSTCGKWR